MSQKKTQQQQTPTDQPTETKLLELTPGWAEGWLKVSLRQSASKLQVIQRGHNYCYALDPSDFVIAGIVKLLEREYWNASTGSEITSAGLGMLKHHWQKAKRHAQPTING